MFGFVFDIYARGGVVNFMFAFVLLLAAFDAPSMDAVREQSYVVVYL